MLVNNLASILHKYLVRLKAAIAANAIASIGRLNNLGSDSVLAAFSLLGKCSACAEGFANATIGFAALVEQSGSGSSHRILLQVCTRTWTDDNRECVASSSRFLWIRR